jgi:hypothetical protein
MPLRITSRRDGFRRCGIAHPATPTTHADGQFSAEQIAVLKAEPMLIVEVLPDPGAPLKSLPEPEIVETVEAVKPEPEPEIVETVEVTGPAESDEKKPRPPKK